MSEDVDVSQADLASQYAEREQLVDDLVELFERDEDDDADDSRPAVFTVPQILSELSLFERRDEANVQTALRFLLSQGRIVRSVPGGRAPSGFTRVAFDESGKEAAARITAVLRQRAAEESTT